MQVKTNMNFYKIYVTEQNHEKKYPYEVLITFPNIIIECLRDLDCPGGHVCLNNKCMKGTLHL